SLKTSDPTSCQGFEYTDSDLETVQNLGANYDQEANVWRYQGKILLPQGSLRNFCRNYIDGPISGTKK
ncbi:hypothetical protein ACQP3J_31440, partial [Escherichia coli]